MKNLSLVSGLLCAASLLLIPPALGHGSPEPQHGGVVQLEHELVFELVREKQAVALYISDHGEPYQTKVMSGTIMVLDKGSKADAVLHPAGENKMCADINIPDGAKVLVKVKSGDHHPVTVRYTF
ncbi:hypothetical protein [Lacimicrobium sp. SS2-24]|uniref:hypothetical protein n=1 Tax=Lacimicrobium sp. SS2-24 TaxID=2005569 RepID=UPI000B4B307B|nr:hypothetical protein [Lacimicrobium sp. SS2-24]